MSSIEEVPIDNPVEPSHYNFSCDDIIGDIPHPLPGSETSYFRIGIVGKSGSGKTNLLRHLTERSGKNRIYCKRFENVFYISPSVGSMSSKPKLPAENFHDSINAIPQIFKDIQTEEKAGRSLIVMDDIGHELKQGNQEYMKKLFFNCRHIGTPLMSDCGKQISSGAVSTMLLTQRLNSIPRNLRSQMTHWIIFDCRSTKSELQTIFEELIHVDKKDFNTIISRVFSKKYNFIFIDTTKSKIYNGFSSEFILNLDKFM